MTTEELISGCKAGDRKCQNSLVHEFAPRLLAICNRYCNDQELAKDALQECFINAFKYIHTYNGSGSFEGWLRRIAVTCSIAVNKKSSVIRFQDYDMEDETHNVTLPDAYSKLGVEEILKLLSQLPKSMNLVFNLYVVEGFSHKEIGEMLSITESTSRSNLTKARARLIEIMQKNDHHIFGLKNLKAAIW